MTIARLLIASLFLLIGFGVEVKAQPLSVSLEKGALQLKTPTGTVVSNMRLRLRFGDDSALVGDLELAGQDQGTDKTGKYERLRYRLKPNASVSTARTTDAVTAMLEIRHYLQPGVVVASLDYNGPALAAR